jgi:hypothetical protein
LLLLVVTARVDDVTTVFSTASGNEEFHTYELASIEMVFRFGTRDADKFHLTTAQLNIEPTNELTTF